MSSTTQRINRMRSHVESRPIAMQTSIEVEPQWIDPISPPTVGGGNRNLVVNLFALTKAPKKKKKTFYINVIFLLCFFFHMKIVNASMSNV